MPPKTLKCGNCKVRFPAETMTKYGLSNFHSEDCAVEYGQAASAKARAKQLAKANQAHKVEQKAARAQHKADKKRVNRSPRAEALKAAQLLSRVSAADDDGYCTCSSCGVVQKWNEMDGGHFIAKGDSSYWSLDQRNLSPQCKPCNGNGMKYGTAAITYTAWMIDKYGKEFIDHMIEVKRTITKRNTPFYDEYIAKTNKEIAAHKKRIGAT